MNKWDIALCLGLMIASLLIAFTLSPKKAKVARVYYDNTLVASLPLDQDDILVLKKSQYPLLLADVEIEVKDKKVRVKKEQSPYHICARQGWSNSGYKPLVCLPNHVYVRIESFDFDGVDAQIS